MPRRSRKQKVNLRFKRREEIKHRLQTVLVRSVVLALVVGFGAGLVTGGDSFLTRFAGRHTPQIDVQAPKVLAGVPVLEALPKNRFWLWFPGAGLWLQRRLCPAPSAVRAIRLERHFVDNRLVVFLEPRLPLVSWNGSGFDQDGVLFALMPGFGAQVPQAGFLAGSSKPELSRWLLRLSAVQELWPQVASIRQDSEGSMVLTFKTGVVVIWGPLDSEPVARKAQTLLRALDDAHHHLGGAARADLRFFEQGRIIVLPKGVGGD